MLRLLLMLFGFFSLSFAAEGLLGEYYNANNFSNKTGERVDTTINFAWGNSRPTGMVSSNDNFSVIWTGYIIVPETANYTFHVAHDDYMRVRINGNVVYENSTWTDGANNFNTFTINNLQEGAYPIEIRFIEYTGGAYAKLAWSNNASIGSRTIIASQYLSTTNPTPPSGYCTTHGLTNGFHVINPLNDVTKSFEIFCYSGRDYIALPNKNTFNNFVFNNDSLASNDYYSQANTNSQQFQAIEINALTMEVMPSNQAAVPQNIGNFKVMGSTFSNINLIGTPFAIDWSQTQISNCTEAKLRKAYYGQAVKINTLNYDNKAICQINNMKLKLLDDYMYLTLNEEEVLENTCKLMAEAVPANILPSEDIKGHYWIKPNQNGRSHANNDITRAIERPIIAYCWYQADLDWAWTFLLAMDGERTISKSDLTSKQDSCSKMGLFPFVPNREDTFERVRKFLYDSKNQWDNYTGTIEEKISALRNNTYYLSSERNQPIWPYGSFGVYYPTNGSSSAWRGSNDTNPGYMSGSPMHNIPAITSDYERYGEFYSYGRYSNTDTIATPVNIYEYKDTMGAKGWVSILGSSDLNVTNEWFVSRTGAGENITGPTVYFEPNGNYTGGCWLNYLFDDQGRVRHNDDWDCNYPYYDYMCMAEDNYDFTQRYSLIRGNFDAIEPDASLGDRFIQTKIVNNPIQLDGILLNNEGTGLALDQNISFGLFLATTQMQGSVELPEDILFIGDDSTIDISSGRFPLPLITISQAYKRLFLRFKFCSLANSQWTECWQSDLNGAKTNQIYAQISESDDFAVRPDKFELSFTPNSVRKIAEKEYVLDFKAIDGVGNPTVAYNETIPFEHTETNTHPDCISGVFSPSPNNIAFVNGQKTINEVTYNEAGRINIKIKETVGSEFAAIDASDTPESLRLISQYDQNISFVPNHFNINASLKQAGGSYTYINSSIAEPIAMAAVFDINISAAGENNNTLRNYSSNCYAQDSNLTFSFQTITPNPTNAIERIVFHEASTNSDGNVNIDQNDFVMDGLSKSIFSDGNATLALRVNFERKTDIAAEPFRLRPISIGLKDFNDITGTFATNDHNATFYYGRVHAPDQRFGGKSGTARVYYEVFCRDCDRTDFNAAGDPSPDTLNWFQNIFHDNLTDGNVTLFTSVGNVRFSNANYGTAPVAAQTTAVVDGLETQNLIINQSPYIDRIEITPSPWLVFNPFVDTNTTDFIVEFTSKGKWAGEGTVKKSGVIDHNATGAHSHDTNENNTTLKRNNKRINW